MTREEAKQILIDAGIEEPTKEAIDNLLNKHNAEVQKQKAEVDKLKGLASENEDLKKQLEDVNNAKLTDIEKIQKENEKNVAKIAELEKQMAISERKKALAEKGIVGEQADKLIGEDGNLDIEILGQILSERETKAKTEKEQELLKGTPNPNGGNNNDNDNKADEDFAKDIASHMAGSNNGDSSDIVAKYL